MAVHFFTPYRYTKPPGMLEDVLSKVDHYLCWSDQMFVNTQTKCSLTQKTVVYLEPASSGTLSKEGVIKLGSYLLWVAGFAFLPEYRQQEAGALGALLLMKCGYRLFYASGQEIYKGGLPEGISTQFEFSKVFSQLLGDGNQGEPIAKDQAIGLLQLLIKHMPKDHKRSVIHQFIDMIQGCLDDDRTLNSFQKAEYQIKIDICKASLTDDFVAAAGEIFAKIKEDPTDLDRKLDVYTKEVLSVSTDASLYPILEQVFCALNDKEHRSKKRAIAKEIERVFGSNPSVEVHQDIIALATYESENDRKGNADLKFYYELLASVQSQCEATPKGRKSIAAQAQYQLDNREYEPSNLGLKILGSLRRMELQKEYDFSFIKKKLTEVYRGKKGWGDKAVVCTEVVKHQAQENNYANLEKVLSDKNFEDWFGFIKQMKDGDRARFRCIVYAKVIVDFNRKIQSSSPEDQEVLLPRLTKLLQTPGLLKDLYTYANRDQYPLIYNLDAPIVEKVISIMLNRIPDDVEGVLSEYKDELEFQAHIWHVYIKKVALTDHNKALALLSELPQQQPLLNTVRLDLIEIIAQQDLAKAAELAVEIEQTDASVKALALVIVLKEALRQGKKEGEHGLSLNALLPDE